MMGTVHPLQEDQIDPRLVMLRKARAQLYMSATISHVHIYLASLNITCVQYSSMRLRSMASAQETHLKRWGMCASAAW